MFTRKFQFEDLCLLLRNFFIISNFIIFYPLFSTLSLSGISIYCIFFVWSSAYYFSSASLSFDLQQLSYSLMVPFFGSILLYVPEDTSEISFLVFFYSMSYVCFFRVQVILFGCFLSLLYSVLIIHFPVANFFHMFGKHKFSIGII